MFQRCCVSGGRGLGVEGGGQTGNGPEAEVPSLLREVINGAFPTTITAELRLGDFKVQGLANTAWAFATASQQDAQLFAALARVAELRLGDFEVQVSELRLGDFNVQGLGNTAWAFATASQQDA